MTTNDMVFGEQDGIIFYSDTAWRFFIDQRNRYLFTSIDYAPLATYESTGPDDATAVFLNAMLYTPGDKTIEGEPPVEVPSWPCRGGDEDDATEDSDLPREGRDMANKGDPALDAVATGKMDTDDDHDIRFLLATLTDEDIAREAEQRLKGENVGSQQPGVNRLREYWVHGKGAAKIRWGMPNDFYRCVEH